MAVKSSTPPPPSAPPVRKVPLHCSQEGEEVKKATQALLNEPVLDNLPEDYEVPGWERHVNRDVAHYIRPGDVTALIRPALSKRRRFPYIAIINLIRVF